MDRNQLIDNRILNPCCKILSVSEAFCAGCIKPDYLPPVIWIPEIRKIRLVLSEKEEFYYKVTSNDCGCIQFDSGIRPCFHQLRALGIFVNKNKEENEQEKCLSEEKRESVAAENAKLWIKLKREETEKCRKKDEERKKEDRRRKEKNRHKKKLLHELIETLPKLRQKSLKQDSYSGIIVEQDNNYNPTKAEEDSNYRRDLYG